MVQIATFDEGEKSLSELAQTLLGTEGAGGRTTLRGAESALRRANPGLDPRAKIAAGAPIVVPDIAGLELREDLHPIRSTAGALMDEALGGLGGLRSKLEASTAAEQAEIDSRLAMARSPELRKFAQEAPAAAEVVAGATAKARIATRDLEGRKKLHADGLTQIERDLHQFRQTLS